MWYGVDVADIVVVVIIVVVVVAIVVVIGKLTQELSELYDHASITVVALVMTRHCRKASGHQFGLPLPGSSLGKAERSKGIW